MYQKLAWAGWLIQHKQKSNLTHILAKETTLSDAIKYWKCFYHSVINTSGRVFLWSTGRYPVRASSFQGKAKNLKWLFYVWQKIFKSFKVLRRGRSLRKEEALPWGWLSPALWLQTESFERQTKFTAFNSLRTGLLNCLNARSRGLNFRHRASCI